MASDWENPPQEYRGETAYQRPDKKDKGKDAEGRTQGFCDSRSA